MAEQSLVLQTGAEPFPGYRLKNLLGRGGYAEVWEATTGDGSSVALKFSRCDDANCASNEIRAIQQVKAIRHPYLINIHQVWTAPGYVVFAMELAEGSLMDLLYAHYEEYGGPLQPDDVCVYLGQAAEAIDYLNSQVHVVDGKRVSIQHGDIKPSNILLFGDTVKLADFGLSVTMSSNRLNRRPFGTVHFAASEVFQGFLTSQSDQFALAVSYCLLRGGRLPFNDSPPSFRVPYTRPDPDLTMLPENERPIIARALSSNPSFRWPSCQTMLGALTRLHHRRLAEPMLAR